MSAYEYDIKYIKGKTQYEADLLSRNPLCGFLTTTQIIEKQPQLPPSTLIKTNIDGLHTIKRKETLALMNEAYENEILSRTQVVFWYKGFKDGRKSIADDSRSGRPLTSTTDRNIGQTIRRQSRFSCRKKMDAKVLGTKFQDFDGILGRSTSNPRYINPRRNAFEVDKSSISKYALVSVVQAKILI
ncbi:hypothetical protein LAZ67_11001886 [Cordylochernes scorpioides]|uniref:Uncharacterized protein n=1 Tax=Cordylochernes scorpioides TaxID=51811 RepID=A0ABY6KZA0_9ARAC|nr:hypothetical protein LAZ67_11001886 [Cordylochernes scorpioides]